MKASAASVHLGVAALLGVAVLAAQGTPGLNRQEFPDYDAGVLTLVNTGAQKKRASAALAEAPDGSETARLLASQNRMPEALATLRRIVDRYPGRIEAAFRGLDIYRFRSDASRTYATDLLGLTRDARARLKGLPLEDHARAAFVLLTVESHLDRSQTWAARLQAFVDEFAGTETALLAQVDIINAGPFNAARLDALDAFARQHPGTRAAAKAIYQKGFDLAHNATALRIERTGDDPTPRFARVMEVVRELSSGQYPPSEWVDRAPQLLSGFSLFRPKFASVNNVEAILATYREVVARDMPRDPVDLPDSSLAYLITGKMGELHALAGRDRIAGVEQELDALERLSPMPGAVRLLRAQFYLQNLVERPEQRDALIAKARSTLDTLAAGPAEPFARRALATLAALHFHERQYAAAIPQYQRYLAKYPTSDWAWVAALRLGQSQEAAGDVATAAATFEALASRAGNEDFIRVIGHAYAAEALASLGRVGDATRQAERALALWDDDYGAVYRSQGRQALLPGQQVFDIRGDGDIAKASLPARIEELRQAAALPGGAALERGRALMRRSRFSDARALLERAADDARGTPLAPAATALAHRARLEHALSLASLDNAKRDDAAAIVELEALSAEPVSFPVIAAQITRATMRATGGGAEEADSLMTAALNTWRTQHAMSPAPTSGSLEADLAAIRSVVFAPLGGGVYTKGRWNAFDFPSTLPSFLIVNPSMQVILDGGVVQRVTLRRPIAGFSNVLYLDDEQLDLMDRMIRSLGGTGRRQPAQIMETPNQPVGRAVDVRAYWNRFFPMRQGHWSGWVFQTYPIIRDVTFQNTQRTRAAVRVEIGYSGGTVVMEKQQGVWRAIDIVNMWVT